MSKKTRSILFLSLVVPVLIVAGFICFDKDDRDREMICRLFHVQPEAIADVTVNVINRHTGKTASRFNIPNQDSDYYVEGCYRLPRQALAPIQGAPHIPADYQQYTGESISDWRKDDDFKSSLLKVQVPGDVLFSPETGWVYFNLDI